jgi:2-oxo-4-hydroxy-4-carboxy-5-ureidoimidazoline decarboxylase
VNITLAAWNQAGTEEATAAMTACCGATRWAQAMVAARPIDGIQELSAKADEIWLTMQETDWMEAFACHPRIGDRKPAHASKRSAAWSQQEQSSARTTDEAVLAELSAGNALYERRFGFTYIVCATGKSAAEMLAILNRRLSNDRTAELREASEQQRQITQIRLGKWLIQ